MNLLFLPEGDTIFALAQNQTYRGQHHEELIYAEITTHLDSAIIKWNDSFFKPEVLPGATLEVAKRYVQQNHNFHKPESVGKAW